MRFNLDLEAARLRELLTYHPLTGIFTWNISRGSRKKDGIAGNINTTGHIQIQIDGKVFLALRLAFLWMTEKWPADRSDHRNLIKTNNVWTNLRECTHSQNRANVPCEARNTSGYKGVYWHAIMGRWCASIKKDGIKYALGYFDAPQEGHIAYAAKAKELFGEFARAA